MKTKRDASLRRLSILWAVLALFTTFLAAVLAPMKRLSADLLPYDVTLLEPGRLNDSFRDLDPCGRLVGSRQVFNVRGGERPNWPLVRHGPNARVFAPPGGSGAIVATNGSGWFAGYALNDGQSRPFVQSPDGIVIELDVGAGDWGTVSDIDEGSTAVTGYVRASAESVASLVPVVWKLYREEGEVWAERVDLPLPGGTWGQANGVNQLGEIVGTAMAGDGLPRAVLWLPLDEGDYDIVEIGQGFGLGLAESGVAVGSVINESGAYEAFAYLDGEVRFLSAPSNCPGCAGWASEVSTAGIVAGHVSLLRGRDRAVVWDLSSESSQAVDLVSMLPLEYIEAATLDSTLAVNAAGEILASGTYEGRRVQFLLAPQREVEVDYDGNGIRDVCETSGVEVITELTRLGVDQSTQLYVIATTNAGEEVDVTRTAPIVGSSVSPMGVVSLSEDGIVTAIAPGRATVTIRYAGHVKTVDFVVPGLLDPCVASWHGRVESAFDVVLDTHCSRNSDDIVAAEWDFGDGSTGSGVTVSHEYAEPGVYTVTVTVTDSTGQTATTTSTVELYGNTSPSTFRRGDTNGDGFFDVSDLISILLVLFVDADAFDCEDAADLNDDGAIDLSDTLFGLNHLFLHGEPIAAPGIFACGDDISPDGLGCQWVPDCATKQPSDPITGFRPDDYEYNDLDAGTRTRTRPPGGRPMHTGVGIGETWTVPEDGDDPRDTPGPIIFGEEIDTSITRPLIVVPGILASALIDPADGSQVWPPYNASGGLRDPRDLATITNLEPNGLIYGFYNELIHFLQAEMGYVLGETLFVFPYDWTRSNMDSGRKLAAFIRVVQESHNPRWEDVDVIAHSMGGIITRAARIFFSAPVNRTAYLASPHYGASKAYFALHDDIALPVSNNARRNKLAAWLFGDLFWKVTVAARGLPSVWELLPDDFYFDKGESPALAYGRKLVNTLHCYELYRPTSFRTPTLIGESRRAMNFKNDLGPDLPGEINAILYNSSVMTFDYANWTQKWYWWNHGFDGPFDSGQGGDGTVPTKSGIGPGPAILVPGDHTGLPNLRPTWNVIAVFLVTS